MAYGVSALPCRFSVSLLELAAMTKRSRRVAAGLDLTRNCSVTLGSQAKKLDPFHWSWLTERTVSSESIALPFSRALPFREEFLFLLAHVMKHSSNGSQSPQLGELAAHLADLKKSEALRTSQAPEIRKYLEQLNATQRLKATSLNAFAPCPLRPQAVTLQGRPWPVAGGIGLGLLLLGFVAGSLYAAHGRRTPDWML